MPRNTYTTHVGRAQTAGAAIVLGGGIAGLTAADRLVGAGWRVTIVEATDRCGGTHRDRSIGPFSFDAASIFYEESAPIFDLAPDLRAECPQVTRVQRRIGQDGRVHRYPLVPSEAFGWPLRERIRAGRDLLLGRLFVRRDGTLEAICRRRLGDTIFRTTGLRDYTERFNRAPPCEIDESFFFYRMTFIERATRFQALWRAGRYRGTAYRWTPPARLRIRPAAGYDRLFDRIVEKLAAKGVRFALSRPLERICRKDGRLEVEAGGEHFLGERVIGALPIDLLHRAAVGTGSGLSSIDLITLFVSAEALAPGLGNVLFNFHGHGLWKRLTIYSRLYPEIEAGREFFSAEVTLAPGMAREPGTYFDDLVCHLTSLGLARGLRLEGHDVVEHAYPFCYPGYQDVRSVAEARIEAAGVIPAGRQGAFVYLPTSTGVIRHVDAQLQRHDLLGVAPAGEEKEE